VELYDRRNPLPLQYNETMGKWLVAAAVAAMVTGCKFGAGEFACVTSSDCGAGGTCEVGLNRCSFNDLSCPAPFRRFGDLAGDNSGQCVGGQAPVDAGPDAPPVSTQVCYGSGLLRICLAAAPSAPLAYDVPARIDTSKPQMCSATVSGAAGYCVVVATTIAINANVRAIGPKPLVFLASDAITSMAGTNLDVGSYHFAAGSDPDNGAGANPTTCAPGMAPTNGGGGAGGSFAGTGGNGGDGRNATNTGGTAGAAVTTFAELRGGCPGQDGQGAAADRGTAGNGGGAVYFLAVNKIELAGNVLATGGGGNPGLRNASGAGGGGSGGMIGFDAPVITVTGTLIANGGSGAEGSGNTGSGRPGNDATTLAAAAGGSGGPPNGGDGGDGSATAANGPGAVGKAGSSGGGGGGGGAGVIKAPAVASLGTKLSPAATP